MVTISVISKIIRWYFETKNHTQQLLTPFLTCKPSCLNQCCFPNTLVFLHLFIVEWMYSFFYDSNFKLIYIWKLFESTSLFIPAPTFFLLNSLLVSVVRKGDFSRLWLCQVFQIVNHILNNAFKFCHNFMGRKKITIALYVRL